MALNRRAVTIVAMTLALAAAGAPRVAAHDDKLDEIQSEIAQKKRRIQQVEQDREGVQQALERSQQERRSLAQEVRTLGEELDDARARLAEVREGLEAARLELRRWSRKLDRARGDLRSQQHTLDQRAATAYKLGPGGYVEILLGAQDLGALVDRLKLVSSVLTVDTDVLEGIRTTRGLVAQRQQVVEEVEVQLEERHRAVQEETRRIVELEAQQLAALQEIDHHLQVQEDAIQDLEAAKERYEKQVAELQAESERIQGLLQGSGSTGSGRASGTFFWPTAGSISSGFGWRTHPIYGTQRFHSGVDIGGGCGQPIWAAEKGTVISAGWNGGYGNATVIDHGGGLATLYAHQSGFAVSGGQTVQRGQTIGYVGTTGLSTGCHLHFEVRVNGSPVDPVPYLT